ncbi:MAG: RidA family protein [Geminicoccaceae bacterium]
MRTPVKTHLPGDEAPIEWAVTADGVLYTAQIPMRADGSIETGPIERQAEVTFDNLRRTLEAAGGSLDDVTQVLIYLTDPAAFVGMNAVYRRFFAKPYPNRATVIVAGLMVPGAVIEIVAYAHLKRG